MKNVDNPDDQALLANTPTQLLNSLEQVAGSIGPLCECQ